MILIISYYSIQHYGCVVVGPLRPRLLAVLHAGRGPRRRLVPHRAPIVDEDPEPPSPQ